MIRFAKQAFWLIHPKTGEKLEFKPGIAYTVDDELANNWFFSQATFAPDEVKPAEEKPIIKASK